MSHDSLQDVLFTRLTEQGHGDAPWTYHLLAACEGDDAIARLIDGNTQPSVPATRTDRSGPAATAPRLFVRSIQVRGFRGIGPQSSLEVKAGPGLTLVCGRNGSGKSSFVEALEVLLTGTSVRWKDRQATWRQGWRNLHEEQTPVITALVDVEGLGSVTLSRKWPREADLDAAATVVKAPDGTRPLADVGWDRAAVDYRPFLSYSELGAMLEDARSALHDALLAGLGLEQFEVVRKRLVSAASGLKAIQGQAKQDAAALLESLQRVAVSLDMPDGRVDAAIAGLGKRQRDLDALERLAVGTAQEDPAVARLKALLAQSPPAGDVTAAVTALRSAASEMTRVTRLASGRTRQLMDLLGKALEVTAGQDGDACPVCRTGGVIDATWRASTTALLQTLEADAREADVAARALAAAVDDARSYCVAVPSVVSDTGDIGVDREPLRRAWTRLAAGRQLADAEALAVHLETECPKVGAALSEAQAAAARELERREDVWRPVASAMGAWLAVARAAERSFAAAALLKDAESWLKQAMDDIRRERFEPIVQQAVQYWSQVRLQSNVDLRDITLVGAGNRRSVSLDVTVDGSEAPALGVMSQGELNCLALSLFLPRATLPESPFGFVIVDDPVQAMDPAKVEGLARALSQAAATHQVIVFTHDDRLPDAVRRLGLHARVLEVSRRTGSRVDVRSIDGPVESALNDAHAVVRTPDVPESIKQRLVPGFGRSALEAACAEAVRSRRLGRGESHDSVAALLDEARSLRKVAALALFDDMSREGEVDGRLKRAAVPRAADTFQACLKGAHGQFTGDAEALVGDVRKLAEFLRARVKVSA